jgi:tRNA pseudouridine32 synthase/23S rRNA pseudouridine746 synthase
MRHLPIILDHPDFIVINKPVGVPMHDPDCGVCQLLSEQLNGVKVYLVHRLDTATSGCLLFAKNASAASLLSTLFQQRKVNKTYIAICNQKPKKKQGKIAGDMQKTRKGNYKLTNSQDNPAITFFQSIVIDNAWLHGFSQDGRLPSASVLYNHRLIYLKPVTGKTHQLRVALKSMGSPIIGDERYKGTDADRLYLHSYALDFEYDGEWFNVRCLPESGELFAQMQLDKLTTPDELTWPKYQPPNNANATIADTNSRLSPGNIK